MFQSTRPVRGATASKARMYVLGFSFNPRAPCGARRSAPCPSRPRAPGFNPRAPCGARRQAPLQERGWRPVSIHAPRAGRDHEPNKGLKRFAEFQSTRPVRGATYKLHRVQMPLMFQSTRPVRGATCLRRCHGVLPSLVSIHAPRAGRDCQYMQKSYIDVTTIYNCQAT